MAELTSRRISGSSMIETIVASLVFTTVFVVSLSTLTSLSLREDEGYVILEAERALVDGFARYGDGTWLEGEYADTFDWGEMRCVITRYRDYERLQEVVLAAHSTGSRKTIEHRGLAVKKDE